MVIYEYIIIGLAILVGLLASFCAYLIIQRLKHNESIVFSNRTLSGRRSGKTTRLIDSAIQKLYKYGKIEFPHPTTYNKFYSPDFHKEYYCICDGVDTIENQERFYHLTKRRLMSEHSGLEFNDNKLTIKLIPYENSGLQQN